jgi:hypothetical protein
VITLNDLTPRQDRDPKGGSGGSAKMVFGERPIVTGEAKFEEKRSMPRREKSTGSPRKKRN